MREVINKFTLLLTLPRTCKLHLHKLQPVTTVKGRFVCHVRPMGSRLRAPTLDPPTGSPISKQGTQKL